MALLSRMSIGAGPKQSVHAWRIDSEHGNSLARWKELGSPKIPSKHELNILMGASMIAPQVVVSADFGGCRCQRCN